VEQVRRILEAYRDLEIDSNELQQQLSTCLHVDRREQETSKSIRVTWTGPIGLNIPLRSEHLLRALDATTQGRESAEALRTWALLMILLDDCFAIGVEQRNPSSKVIPDILHSLADDEDRDLDEGGVRYLKECLIQGESPDLSLL